MSSIGVEEAAAVGAEHFYGDLRSDWADSDCLLGASKRGGLDIGTERLGDTLPDQKQSVENTDREQDVQCAAGDVDPKAAHGAHRMTREAANERDREHDACCRRKIVLMRQAEHLHEIGQ